jgi:hypothetical protein
MLFRGVIFFFAALVAASTGYDLLRQFRRFKWIEFQSGNMAK